MALDLEVDNKIVISQSPEIRTLQPIIVASVSFLLSLHDLYVTLYKIPYIPL